MGLVLIELGLDFSFELLVHCELVLLELLLIALQLVVLGPARSIESFDLLGEHHVILFHLSLASLVLKLKLIEVCLGFLQSPLELIVLPLEVG
jgi:hypothetical protein